MKGIDADLSYNCVIPLSDIEDMNFITIARGKGVIIPGYPCIGKSSIAGSNFNIPVIDLESSNFDKNNPLWSVEYVKIAHDLAKQGFVVMTSTHKHIIDTLLNLNDVEICTICPCRELYTEWVVRATKRYESTGLEKDKRALDRIIDYYKSDIDDLIYSGLPNYTIYGREYNLSSIVYCIYRCVNDRVC